MPSLSSRPAFNANVADLAPPPIPLAQSWAAGYDGAAGPLIDLAQAVPGYPPHPEMLERLAAAAGSREAAGYGDIEGDPELRAAVAEETARLYGAPVGPDEVHIVAGCNQAFVVAALAVAGPGRRVALSNPFYFNHEASLAMLGIGVDHFECRAEDGFLPRPEALARVLDAGARAVALVSPNNPTGATYPPALLDEIADLCVARDAWLILDETYRDFLAEPGSPHGLFADPRRRARTIQLYSFSKSYCVPGHRLGSVIAVPEAIAQIAKIMDNLQICAPRAAQIAAAWAIGAHRDWRRGNAETITRRAEALRDAIAGAPPWRIRAMGAYFAYIEHGADDGRAVAERLAREAGVICLPGAFFGRGQEPFLRFAFANAEAEVVAGLGARLARLDLSVG